MSDRTRSWCAAAIAGVLAVALALLGSVAPASAATPDYSLSISAPATANIGASFNYDIELQAPNASATPLTGVVLTLQLDENITYASVPTDSSSPVASVSYNGTTHVLTLTMKDMTTSLNRFAVAVTQSNNNPNVGVSTVFDATLSGNQATGGTGTPDPVSAQTAVVATIAGTVAKGSTTVLGSDARTVQYTFVLGNPGTVVWHDTTITDVLPAGAVVESYSPEFSGGTWSITPNADGTTTATWHTSALMAPGTPKNNTNDIWLVVTYPLSAFPSGTRPPLNTANLTVVDATGDTATNSGATQSGTLRDPTTQATHTASQFSGTPQTNSRNVKWQLEGSYINPTGNGDNLTQLMTSATATQSPENALCWNHLLATTIEVTPNSVLRALDLPMEFWYQTSDSPETWVQHDVDWTTGTPHIASYQYLNPTQVAGYDTPLPIPAGAHITGVRVIVKAADGVTIPLNSQVTVGINGNAALAPLDGSAFAPTAGPFSCTATTEGTSVAGLSLPSSATAAVRQMVDEIPIGVFVSPPSTLPLGGTAVYRAGISNNDPGGRAFEDTVLSVVLPVGVTYDAGVGVTPLTPTTAITDAPIPTIGNGLTVTTSTVTDAAGSHQVVHLTLDQIESVRTHGPKLTFQSHSQGYNYTIPVIVSGAAAMYATTRAPVSVWGATLQPEFATVPMTPQGTVGWAAADTYDLNPNLSAIATANGTSQVPAAQTLLLTKLVEVSPGSWGTAAAQTAGSAATWAIQVTNLLSTPVTSGVLFDRLPYVGDSRGSTLAVTVNGPITGLPDGATVEYSTDATSATTGTWTTTPTGATAFRVNLPSIATGSSFELRIPTLVPATAQGATTAINVASVTGLNNGQSYTFSTGRATVTVPAAPAITLDKSAELTTPAAAGATVEYSFAVTNTGNVPLTDITINETAFSGTGELSDIVCEDTELAPDASTTCSATYVVTDADVEAGEITNTATATGTPPSGEPVTSDPSDADVPLPVPSLSIVKTADPTTVDGAGATVTYSFEVTNTGNVPLTGITVNETAFSGTGELSDIVCEATELAIDASTTCSATYEVTQADADAGEITNTATATGTPPAGSPVTSDPSDANVTIPPAPSLTVVKTADPTTVDEAGATVSYSFEVTNTGNVTLTDITINETEFSGTGELSEVVCEATELAPNASTTCSATYEVTQADADAGEITNTATATGTPPAGEPVTSDPSDAKVTIPPAPSLTVVKTADPTTVTAVGATVTYSFEVTNTGNVTLTDITINETAFSGTGDLSEIVCEATELAPDASTTCSATYIVTQADVLAGTITNTATATGTPPSGEPVTSDPSDATVVIKVAVVPPATGLPTTGSIVPVALVGPAALLLLAGLLLLRRSRRAAN